MMPGNWFVTTWWYIRFIRRLNLHFQILTSAISRNFLFKQKNHSQLASPISPLQLSNCPHPSISFPQGFEHTSSTAPNYLYRDTLLFLSSFESICYHKLMMKLTLVVKLSSLDLLVAKHFFSYLKL